MKKSTNKILGKAGLLMGIVIMPCPVAGEETIYKCINGNKINFTSSPGEGQNCRSVELKVVQPNPEEVARELEKKRLRDEEEQKEEARTRVDKKQRETESALRRAKSAEEALRLLKDSPPTVGNGRSRTWTGVFPRQTPEQGRPEIVTMPRQGSTKNQ